MTREQEMFYHWVSERENVRALKESGAPKPWSKDPVFQTTYFCNVRREDDKVTKWVREWANGLPLDLLLPYYTLARMLNWPPAIEEAWNFDNYDFDWDSNGMLKRLKLRRDDGEQIFNGAYLITTCGVKMDKLDYVMQVCSDVKHGVETEYTLAEQAEALQRVNGLGSFLSAQVVADIKNHKGSWLEHADDRWSWCAPGPGSLRGVAYYIGTPGKTVKLATFYDTIKEAQRAILLEFDMMLCAQDVQNCFCEYSKYMRVLHGGRSKRGYPGKS